MDVFALFDKFSSQTLAAMKRTWMKLYVNILFDIKDLIVFSCFSRCSLTITCQSIRICIYMFNFAYLFNYFVSFYSLFSMHTVLCAQCAHKKFCALIRKFPEINCKIIKLFVNILTIFCSHKKNNKNVFSPLIVNIYPHILYERSLIL